MTRVSKSDTSRDLGTVSTSVKIRYRQVSDDQPCSVLICCGCISFSFSSHRGDEESSACGQLATAANNEGVLKQRHRRSTDDDKAAARPP